MNVDIVKSGLTEVKVLPLKASGQQKRSIHLCISRKVMDNFANVHIQSVQGCDYYDNQCCAQSGWETNATHFRGKPWAHRCQGITRD